MITKFLLIVWLGSGQTQTFSQIAFDTRAECEAARQATYAVTQRAERHHMCVPYTFDPAQD